MGDKIWTKESVKRRYYPADPDGVWVSSNEVSPMTIAACQCVPGCWLVNAEGFGQCKIDPSYSTS